MSTDNEQGAGTIGPEITLAEEVPMVCQDRWEELRWLWQSERLPIAELARRFELDRKTVRPPVSASSGAAAVSAAGPARAAADAACRISARSGAEGPVLGPDPIPRAAAAGLTGGATRP